jgi:aspartate aminotransferase
MILSKRIQSIGESPTMKISRRAKELYAEYGDVLDMGVGETGLLTPDPVKMAGMQSIMNNDTFYTPAGGIPKLRAKIADSYKENGASAENVVISNGAKHSLHVLFDCLLDPGDKAVILAPYWPTYEALISLTGSEAVVHQCKKEDGFLPKPDELEQTIIEQGGKIKLLVMNCPGNPTGKAFDYTTNPFTSDLQGIYRLAERYDFMIVSDEVYAHVGTHHLKLNSFADLALWDKDIDVLDRVVIVSSFSKEHSMTGWRVGYTIARKEIADAMIKHQSQSSSNVCNIAQWAALAAVRSQELDFFVAMTVQKVIGVINKIEILTLEECIKPDYGFYVFPEINPSLGMSSVEFAEYLLDKHHIAVVPGSAFGTEGHIRISCTALGYSADRAYSFEERMVKADNDFLVAAKHNESNL